MNGILILIAGVVVLNVYALLLVLIRGPLYGTRLYKPMVLNLGLSAAPAVVLAVTMVVEIVIDADPGTPTPWVIFAVGGIVWLLLLPNSAYLITELNFSHRKDGESVPLWFDIVATLALSLSGVMNALVNVLVAQILCGAMTSGGGGRPFASAGSWIVAGAILLLTTIGIYLGRYIRFNSWDIVRPTRFLRVLGTHFAQPGRVREAVGFCLLHTLLLAILYVIVAASTTAALW